MRYDKHVEQIPGYQNGDSSTSVISWPITEGESRERVDYIRII